jgi:hypothetical protein
MPQVFHKSFNSVVKVLILGAPLMFAGTAVGLAAFYRSGYATGMNEVVEQPIPFSHMHHVGQLGIDCRYCHTSVETSGFAGIPPTKTCMNCHQQIWTGAELLEPLRKSYNDPLDKTPIRWKRVHNLPHYTYFNHSIHIAKGVGCVECHGRIDEMPLTFQAKTLLMEWCIDCHNKPDRRLRPREEVFNMRWAPGDKTINKRTGEEYPTDPADLAKMLKQNHGVRDSMTLTSCSMCHR